MDKRKVKKKAKQTKAKQNKVKRNETMPQITKGIRIDQNRQMEMKMEYTCRPRLFCVLLHSEKESKMEQEKKRIHAHQHK